MSMADPAAAAEAEGIAERLQVSIPNLMQNAKMVEGVRGAISIVGGAATGILGATGLQGFALYIALYVFTSLVLLGKMRGKVSSYFPVKWYTFLLEGVTNHILSFMLFWTMLYTLVYIY